MKKRIGFIGDEIEWKIDDVIKTKFKTNGESPSDQRMHRPLNFNNLAQIVKFNHLGVSLE